MLCCRHGDVIDEQHVFEDDLRAIQDELEPFGFRALDPYEIRIHAEASMAQPLPALSPSTPRQQQLLQSLQLPQMARYPRPPGCKAEASPEEEQRHLLEMYRAFVLELLTGAHLKQINSNQGYNEIHCQIMEDLLGLKVTQDFHIVEFPLASASKVYRVVQSTREPLGRAAKTEYVVVLEFRKRKLAFVFKDGFVSQRFVTCMELLVWRARQERDCDDASATLRPPLLRLCRRMQGWDEDAVTEGGDGTPRSGRIRK